MLDVLSKLFITLTILMVMVVAGIEIVRYAHRDTDLEQLYKLYHVVTKAINE